MVEKMKTEIVCVFFPRTHCYFGQGGSWTWTVPSDKKLQDSLNRGFVEYPMMYYENPYMASAKLAEEKLGDFRFKVLGFADEVPKEVEETEDSDEDSGTE